MGAGADSDASFEVTGQPPPAALAGVRAEVHWAAQLPAAAARALIAPASDDSHTSLEWLPGPRLLASRRMPGDLGVAIDPAALAMRVLDPAGATRAELPLAGRTFDEALGWLAAALSAGKTLSRPSYELPAHPLAAGGTFRGDDAPARAELARWYATAALTLRRFAASKAGASPVRCWPHRFDIATSLPVPGEGRSVGVGLSPGDGSYPQPYWYATPWPYPKVGALPPLASGGHWHRAGWLGAVLTGEAVVSAPTAAARARAVADFLEGAARACAALLAAPA